MKIAYMANEITFNIWFTSFKKSNMAKHIWWIYIYRRFNMANTPLQCINRKEKC